MGHVIVSRKKIRGFARNATKSQRCGRFLSESDFRTIGLCTHKMVLETIDGSGISRGIRRVKGPDISDSECSEQEISGRPHLETPFGTHTWESERKQGSQFAGRREMNNAWALGKGAEPVKFYETCRLYCQGLL